MHERDQENWRAIYSGERPATWTDFLGHVEGATYLSRIGADLVSRMAEDFTRWIGVNWLSTAIGADGPGRIPWIGQFSPTLTILGEQGAAGAFIELVRWWAALESQAMKKGMGQVRKDLRNDVTASRLLHTLTQTRLGAIATRAGMAVQYEPKPGDLQIFDDQTCVTVEVFAMRTAQDIDAKLRRRTYPCVRPAGGVVGDPDLQERGGRADAGRVATVGSIIGRVWADMEAKTDPFDELRRIGIDEISYKRGTWRDLFVPPGARW